LLAKTIADGRKFNNPVERAFVLEGRVTIVVTGDPDLLDVREHSGVRIVTPRQFLGMLTDNRAAYRFVNMSLPNGR